MTSDSSDPTTEAAREAMEGLRAIWTVTGQLEDVDLGLECRPGDGGCITSLGFDAFAEAVEPTTDTAEALARLRRAWKETLAREGKLHRDTPRGQVT